MSDNEVRVPPSNLDNEAAVLGAVLLRADALDDVIERGVVVGDFYHPQHRAVFGAMLELDERGQPIDVLTVADHLKSSDEGRRAAVSETLLAELAAKVPTATNVGYYAKLVHDDAVLRRMINTCGKVIDEAFGHPGDATEFVDWAENEVGKVGERRERQDYVSVRQLAVAAAQRLFQRHEQRDYVNGVGTGYADLDRITTGLQPSDLIILAGRPSMGKTAAALNIMRNCGSEGIPSLMLSLEMSRDQIMDRLICAESKLDAHRVRSGQLGSHELGAFTQAMGRVSELPIVINDCGSSTLQEIRAHARRWRRDRTVFPNGDEKGLLVIDYLQLVSGAASKREENREREVGLISRGLKGLAKELGVPVLALSQLNRKLEQRDNKRPTLGDLRESGSLEQDADVVIFLYRECVYEPTDDNGREAEVILGKQRNGPTGTIKLCFFEESGRFENMAQDRGWTAQEPLPLDRRSLAAGADR